MSTIKTEEERKQVPPTISCSIFSRYGFPNFSHSIQVVEKENVRKNEILHFNAYTEPALARFSQGKQKLGVGCGKCARNWMRTTRKRRLFCLASFLGANEPIGAALRNHVLPYIFQPGLMAARSQLFTLILTPTKRAYILSLSPRIRSQTNLDRNLEPSERGITHKRSGSFGRDPGKRLRGLDVNLVAEWADLKRTVLKKSNIFRVLF